MVTGVAPAAILTAADTTVARHAVDLADMVAAMDVAEDKI